MRAVAHAESGMNQAARNPSGAAGLYQFMPATWRELARAHGLPPHPGDEAAQHVAMGHFTRANRLQLDRALGRPAAPWELYLAHNQGAAGASRLLLAGRETKANLHVSPAAVAQNFGAGDPDMRTGAFIDGARAYYERHAAAVRPVEAPIRTGGEAMSEPTFFEDFRTIPAALWRWPNFTPAEIGGKRQEPADRTILVNPAALDALQALRLEWARPIQINSGYRSPDYNRRVGGAPASKHLEGIAFDIGLPPSQHEPFIALARKHGFRGIGRYAAFVHIDTRTTPAEWRG